jgi:NADH-quinone oxidoreductase subunit L
MIKAIVFLPLIGALIAGFLGRTIGHRPSEIVTTGLLIVSAVLSWIVFFPWPSATGWPARWSIRSATARCSRSSVMRWIQVGDMDLEVGFCASTR